MIPRPIDEITKKDLRDIKLISFDVDGVFVLDKTIILPEQIEQLKKLKKKGFYLNISSGRNLNSLQKMFRPILKDLSITYEIGSATWMEGEIVQHVNSFPYLDGLYEQLEQGLREYPDFMSFEPKDHMITVACTREIPEILKIVNRHNQSLKSHYKLECRWSGSAYDIFVEKIQTKGAGLRYLINKLGLKKKNSLAIGDNFSDLELLEAAGVSVTADKDKVPGKFYIPLSERLPAAVMMDYILNPRR